MPVFINNRPIKRTREILINKKTLVTTEMEYKSLVFIHIPRCAGLTITAHFTQRYGSPKLTGVWSNKSLPRQTITDSALTKLTGIQTVMTSPEFNPKTPLHHQPLSGLRTYRGSLEVPFNALTRTICCVRNPYDRVISGMFHLGYINQHNSPDEVFTQMLSYLKTSPPASQVSFITDEFGNISTDIRIIRVESIVADMHALGYTDFTGTQRLGRGSWTKPTYSKYLNDESRELIQKFFDNDFKVFNYTY